MNETIFILMCSIYLFWMAVSPGVPRMGCACLLLDSPRLLRVLVALTTVIEPLLPGFLGCRCFGLRGAFSRFCRGHGALLGRCSVGLRALLQQGILEPEFYGDLCTDLEKLWVGLTFRSSSGGLLAVMGGGGVGCGLDVVRRTACLVVRPVVVGGYASLFSCTAAVQASDPMTASS